MRRSSFSPMSPRVSSVREAWSETTSDSASRVGEVDERRAEGLRLGRGHVGIGRQQAHVPVHEAPRHVRAHAAETDEAHRLAEEELAAVLALRPLAAAELGLVVLDALEQHQDEADRRLGDGDEVLRRRAVGDEDARLRRGGEVDLVRPDKGHDDEPEARARPRGRRG